MENKLAKFYAKKTVIVLIVSPCSNRLVVVSSHEVMTLLHVDATCVNLQETNTIYQQRPTNIIYDAELHNLN